MIICPINWTVHAWSTSKTTASHLLQPTIHQDTTCQRTDFLTKPQLAWLLWRSLSLNILLLDTWPGLSRACSSFKSLTLLPTSNAKVKNTLATEWHKSTVSKWSRLTAVSMTGFLERNKIDEHAKKQAHVLGFWLGWCIFVIALESFWPSS